MRKPLVLAAALLMTSAALAQSQQQSQSSSSTQSQSSSEVRFIPGPPPAKQPKPLDARDVHILTGRTTYQNYVPQPAPRKGHPLDPADVDTLTGNGQNGQQSGYRGYVYPYVNYDLGMGDQYGSRYGRSYGWRNDCSLFGVCGGFVRGRRPAFFFPGSSSRPSFSLFTDGTRNGTIFFVRP